MDLVILFQVTGFSPPPAGACQSPATEIQPPHLPRLTAPLVLSPGASSPRTPWPGDLPGPPMASSPASGAQGCRDVLYSWELIGSPSPALLVTHFCFVAGKRRLQRISGATQLQRGRREIEGATHTLALYRNNVANKSPLVLSEETRLIITFLCMWERSHPCLSALWCLGKQRWCVFSLVSAASRHPSRAPCVARAPKAIGQLQGLTPASPTGSSFWGGSSSAGCDGKVLLMYKGIAYKQHFSLNA